MQWFWSLYYIRMQSICWRSLKSKKLMDIHRFKKGWFLFARLKIFFLLPSVKNALMKTNFPWSFDAIWKREGQLLFLFRFWFPWRKLSLAMMLYHHFHSIYSSSTHISWLGCKIWLIPSASHTKMSGSLALREHNDNSLHIVCASINEM